jgi:hypothetical protein
MTSHRHGGTIGRQGQVKPPDPLPSEAPRASLSLSPSCITRTFRKEAHGMPVPKRTQADATYHSQLQLLKHVAFLKTLPVKYQMVPICQRGYMY